MFARESQVDKGRELHEQVQALFEFAEEAARDGRTADEVEREVFIRVLKLGREVVGHFLKLQGLGDLGL